MGSVTGIESIWNKTCKIERKPAMAGGGVALIGLTLIPLLSGLLSA